MISTLSSIFPIQFCTNLDTRPDRLLLAQKELSKLGLTPQRLPGVVWSKTSNQVWNGQIGCGLCHLSGLKSSNQNILMFEDDVIFINNYEETLKNALEELPEDWCMLYLGANVCGSIFQVSPHLGKLTHAQATHAYGINKVYLDRILEIIEPKIETNIIDVLYATEIVPRFPCYITIPMVAVQRSDFSNIENRRVEYASWMEQRFYEQLIRK